MALGYSSIAPSLENPLPFLKGAPLTDMNQLSLSSVIAAMTDKARPSARAQSHRRSAKSVSSLSTAPKPTSGSLRLADVAKQHCMGVHTEDWREDVLPSRQYLPMQHIIGSLKRDRDDATQPEKSNSSSRRRPARHSIQYQDATKAASSDVPLVQMLRTPKRRRTFDNSFVEVSATLDFDPHWSFGYDDSDHLPHQLLPSTLHYDQGLSSTTTDKCHTFSDYTPFSFGDPPVLTNDVLQPQGDVVDERKDDDTPGELDDSSSTIDGFSPVVPPEREIEVRKAFEEFIDFSDSKRYIAKI